MPYSFIISPSIQFADKDSLGDLLAMIKHLKGQTNLIKQFVEGDMKPPQSNLSEWIRGTL